MRVKWMELEEERIKNKIYCKMCFRSRLSEDFQQKLYEI